MNNFFSYQLNSHVYAVHLFPNVDLSIFTYSNIRDDIILTRDSFLPEVRNKNNFEICPFLEFVGPQVSKREKDFCIIQTESGFNSDKLLEHRKWPSLDTIKNLAKKINEKYNLEVFILDEQSDQDFKWITLLKQAKFFIGLDGGCTWLSLMQKCPTIFKASQGVFDIFTHPLQKPFIYHMLDYNEDFIMKSIDKIIFEQQKKLVVGIV